MGKNNGKKKPRTEADRMRSIFAKLDNEIAKRNELARSSVKSAVGNKTEETKNKTM